MLQALTHHKLRPEAERMEDVLTSAVLGAASYLPPQACWIPVLEAARAHAPASRLPVPTIDVDVHATFWPKWSHGDGRFTEPDVVLRWPGSIVCVEVKYLSGKSSEADDQVDHVTDQLARQLVLLRRIAATEGRRHWGLLYLTADVGRPHAALTRSSTEVRHKTGTGAASHLAWTSWRVVHDALQASRVGVPGQQRLARDAASHLAALGFAGFSGISARPTPLPTWRLGTRRSRDRPTRPLCDAFHWTLPTPPPPWSLQEPPP